MISVSKIERDTTLDNTRRPRQHQNNEKYTAFERDLIDAKEHDRSATFFMASGMVFDGKILSVATYFIQIADEGIDKKRWIGKQMIESVVVDR